MPKYSFTCEKCNSTQDKYTPRLCEQIPCDRCDGTANRQMPVLMSPKVNELVDKYTGVKWQQDQTDLVKERKSEYYWEVEVPRLVNSGTYSLETMLEQGWVWVDDNKQIRVHTKPPHKR